MEGITITDSAAERIREVAEREGIDTTEQFLRVAVVSGGCSGLTYDLGWDSVEQEKDRVVGDPEIKGRGQRRRMWNPLDDLNWRRLAEDALE